MIDEAVVPGCSAPPCAPAATSPRSSPRTSARRRRRARRRQGRGAHLRPRPRRRHPRRRRRHHRLRPHRRPVRGRPAGGGRGRGRGGPRRRRRHARSSPSTRRDAAAPQRRRDPARTTSPRPPRSSCSRRADEVARSAGRRHHAGVGPLRRQPPAHPRRQQRRPARRATTRSDPVLGRRAWPRATPACRPAARAIGHTVGFELFDRYDVEELARRGRRAGAHQAQRPPGAERARCRSSSARAAAACCSTRRAATASRPTSSARARRCSPAGSASRWPRRSSRSSTTARWPSEWGCFAIDDEGTPGPAQRAHRGRRAHRLHVGPPAGPQGGPGVVGQRPAPELPAPADGAHDQHLPRRTAPTTPTTSSPTPTNGVYVAQLGGGQVNTATGDFVFGMTEAYLIEDGEITEPLREGNLIGNGPEVLARHRRRRQRLRHGPARHLRQGRPGRAGRRRRPDAAGHGAHRRRHGRLSDRRRATCCDIGDRVVAHGRGRASSRGGRRARPRHRDPGLRGRDRVAVVGRVAGRRHPGDRRRPPGLRLRRHPRRRRARRDARRGPRQRRVRHRPTSSLGLAEPDGVRRARARPVPRRAWRRSPTDAQGRPAPSSSSGPCGPPTRASPASSRPTTATRIAERRHRHHHRHPHRRPRDRRATSSRLRAGRARATTPRPASGSRSAAQPDDLDVDARRRRRRPTGPPACSAPPSRRSERLTVVLDPWVTAQLLGILGATLTRRGRAEGPLAVRRPPRRGGGVAARHAGRRPHRTRWPSRATETDGEGLATRRNVLIDDGVLQAFVHNTYTARRVGHGRPPARPCAGFKSTPGVGCTGAALAARARRPRPSCSPSVGDGVLVQVVSGLHSGVNPVSGDFSTGAEGLRIRGGELAEPVREFTIASTLQRMLHDVVAVGADLEWLPMSAAGVSLVIRDVTVSGPEFSSENTEVSDRVARVRRLSPASLVTRSGLSAAPYAAVDQASGIDRLTRRGSDDVPLGSPPRLSEPGAHLPLLVGLVRRVPCTAMSCTPVRSRVSGDLRVRLDVDRGAHRSWGWALRGLAAAVLDQRDLDLVVVAQAADEEHYTKLCPSAWVVPPPTVIGVTRRHGWPGSRPGCRGDRRERPDVVHSPHYTPPLAPRPVVVTLARRDVLHRPRACTRRSRARSSGRGPAPSLRRAAPLRRAVGGHPRRAGAGRRGRRRPDRRRAPRRRPRGVPAADRRRACRSRGSGSGSGDRRYVAFLGTLEPRKNVPDLVRGWVQAVAGRRPAGAGARRWRRAGTTRSTRPWPRCRGRLRTCSGPASCR